MPAVLALAVLAIVQFCSTYMNTGVVVLLWVAGFAVFLHSVVRNRNTFTCYKRETLLALFGAGSGLLFLAAIYNLLFTTDVLIETALIMGVNGLTLLLGFFSLLKK